MLMSRSQLHPLIIATAAGGNKIVTYGPHDTRQHGFPGIACTALTRMRMISEPFTILRYNRLKVDESVVVE